MTAVWRKHWTWIHSCCLAWFMQENWLVGGVDRKFRLVVGVRYWNEKANKSLMTPDLHVVWKKVPGWQTMVGTQSGQQAAKLATSPPSTPPAPASVSDAHRGQCTHPGFVGQECQESRLLLTSLLLPSKVLSPLLFPIAAQRPSCFTSQLARLSGWLLA